MEGTPILEESPGDLGVLLWQSYRDVVLWGDSEPEHRTQLFAPGSLERREALIRGSNLVGEVRVAIELLTAALRESPPSKPAEIVYCCSRVAEWAAAAGKRYTAFAMALAAAGLEPNDAAIALRVGQYAASGRLFIAAEAWFRRVVGLGRRARDYASYADAWVELGRVCAARAALRPPTSLTIEIDPAQASIEEVNRHLDPRISPEIHSGADHAARARQCFITAARTARRHGMRTTGGEAYHELFLLAFAAGHFGIADRYAKKALRLLGKHHSRNPSLRHAYASLMLRHSENVVAAIQMLEAVLPSRRTTPERIETLLLLVEAAGRAKDEERFQKGWYDALSTIERLGESPAAARHLLSLAQVGMELGEETRAIHAARRAFSLAAHVRDHGLKDEVETFLARPRPGRAA
jgi:tetratricopeptide (TPR) repeat protein